MDGLHRGVRGRRSRRRKGVCGGGLYRGISSMIREAACRSTRPWVENESPRKATFNQCDDKTFAKDRLSG